MTKGVSVTDQTMSGHDAGITVLVYGKQAEAYAARVREARGDLRVYAASTPSEAEPWIDEAEVLFAWRFPVELFDRARRLRWIQSMGAGVEDLVEAHVPASVRITRVVDQFGPPIAEYVFAELLARVRRLDHARALQRAHRWAPFYPGSLAGQTLGVAGLGSIGQEIVRKARAFDMRVWGLSRTAGHAGEVDRHFGPDAWVEFASAVDVLVLALPLTPSTRHVVDARVLGAMSAESLLVNVGRGALVREADLIEALSRGHPGGAILDVFETEPLPPESPLWDMPGVTITPHISGPSRTEPVVAWFLANLERFLAGRALLGEVDRARGY